MTLPGSAWIAPDFPLEAEGIPLPRPADGALAWTARTIGLSIVGEPGDPRPGPPAAESLARLPELLARHRVVPMAEHALRQWSRHASTDASRLLGELAQRRRASARRVLELTRRLAAVVTAIEGAGIRCLALKGVALAARHYPDIGLRDTCDIDLMVARSSLPSVHAVLEAQGFRRIDETTRRPLRGAPSPGIFEHHATYRHDDLILELHHRPHPNPRLLPIPTESLLAACDRVPLAGVAIPVMAEPAHLIYLATHGARHSWRRLQWLLDIWMALRARPAAELAGAFKAAAGLRLGLPLHSGIILARTLFGGALPEPCATAYGRSAALRYAVRHGMDALCADRTADERPVGRIPTVSFLPSVLARGDIGHAALEILGRLRLAASMPGAPGAVRTDGSSP